MQCVFFSFHLFPNSFVFTVLLPGVSILWFAPGIRWPKQPVTDCLLMTEIKGSVVQQLYSTQNLLQTTCLPHFPSHVLHVLQHLLCLLGYCQWNMGEYSHCPPPPLFLKLHHKPSRGNNKQMREMGTVPSESSQVLWQPSINSLVPRLRSRRQAWAWFSQSLSRTGKTWQKPPLPVTFIPTLAASYSHPSTSLDTQIEE